MLKMKKHVTENVKKPKVLTVGYVTRKMYCPFECEAPLHILFERCFTEKNVNCKIKHIC